MAETTFGFMSLGGVYWLWPPGTAQRQKLSNANLYEFCILVAQSVIHGAAAIHFLGSYETESAF